MNAAALAPLSSRAATAVIHLLDRERLMTLACVRPDGWPQATTVGYVNEGLNVYFVVARDSQKFANLQSDSRASIAVRISGPDCGDGLGVSMGGRVAEVTEATTVERLNRAVAERYPDVHVHCPSSDAVATLHFRPMVVSAVGVVKGRSHPETFAVGDLPPEEPVRNDLMR